MGCFFKVIFTLPSLKLNKLKLSKIQDVDWNEFYRITKVPGGKKSFNCNRCESKFRSKKEVLTHVKSSHDLSPAEDADDDDEDEGEDEDDLEEEGGGDDTDGEGAEESKYAH